MPWIDWYNSLVKPSWTPAPSTITLIWVILYPIILISFGFVFVQAFRCKVPRRLAVPFAINLVANLLFMPIFAGLRNVPWAAVDIVIVWATIIWCVVTVWPHYRWIALDDHFANRWAAAFGLDKTGRLRQAGKSPLSRGKDVHHAKPLCASDCLGSRSPKPLAGSDPGPFHPASFGLPLSADPALGCQGSAVQSPSCQRVRLHA
jgi:benzodiazapine receptor